MKQLNHRFYLLAGILFLGLSSHAGASPIGTASITNCAPDGGVTITATEITWLPAAGTNLGCIATGLPTSISYSGGTLTSGTGTISDLPAGSVDPFMVLAGGMLDFSLSAFGTPASTDGICSTTVALTSGHSCVIFTGSPFLLVSEGTSTVLGFTTKGVAEDLGNSSTSPYTGVFSTEFNFTTATIAADILSGGSITDTYSATLTLGTGIGTEVPEPSTLAFLSIGLVLIGIRHKRFGKRERS